MIIVRTASFKKEFKKLPPHIQNKTGDVLRLLVADMRYPSLQVHKMEGAGDIWEARITHQYRFTFCMQGNDLVLRHIGTHDILKKEG